MRKNEQPLGTSFNRNQSKGRFITREFIILLIDQKRRQIESKKKIIFIPHVLHFYVHTKNNYIE